jgi:hypothetical protein
MNTTELPAMIRECVDGGAQPVSLGEVKARAVMTERRVRPGRLGVAAAGVAAAGIAGALVASQVGGTAARPPAVLTAAMLKQVAAASQAAMTSGQARIATATGGSTVVQQVTFDGANWNDVLNPGAPVRVHRTAHLFSWTGESIDRVVDGQAYHYPAFAFKPAPHIAAEWMHIIAPGAGASLNIPDPRTLLNVLSPSAGFVTDGYAIVNGVRAEHLRATTPAGVPLRPLNPLIGTEPDHPRVSALDLWVDPSDVVLKARFTVSGPEQVRDPGVTVTVTFSQIGQPQDITAPARYVTVGGKG